MKNVEFSAEFGVAGGFPQLFKGASDPQSGDLL